MSQGRKCLFGEIVSGVMQLNDAGFMVQAAWRDLPNRYADVESDAFIMPNHIHGIVVLVGAGPCARPKEDGQPQGVAPTRNSSALSLPDVVHRFKSITTKRYIDGIKQVGWPSIARRLWQRNYFEHVIRNDESLQRIRQYIHDNPARWEFDRENPAATRPESKDSWRTG